MAERKVKTNNTEEKNRCYKCGTCCGYVTSKIEGPNSQEGIDEIKWFLVHKNIRVFLDEDNEWYVQFFTHCKSLTDERICQTYEERPDICRDYEPGQCDQHAPESGVKICFETTEQFEEHLKAKEAVL